MVANQLILKSTGYRKFNIFQFTYFVCHLTKLSLPHEKDRKKDIVAKKAETLIHVIANQLRLCGIMYLE